MNEEWAKLFEDYILLNLKDYITGVDFPINIFILSIAVGLCLASVAITVHRRYTANLVKKLMRHEAFSPETALTLADLDIKPGFILKSALQRRGGQLADMIKRVGQRGYTYEEYVALQKKKKFREEKVNFNEAKFYIDPEKLPRARKINEAGAPSYFQAALACIFILSVFICVSLFMPEILNFIAG